MNDPASVRRWRVIGRVQGVGFRASTTFKARSLGIVEGWARNRPDGSVDICAAGSGAALCSLHEWLQHGPPLARVDLVEELPPPATRPPAI